MSSCRVSLIRADSYDTHALRRVLDRLMDDWGGMSALVKPGDRVLLKPNLLTSMRSGPECMTRPELVAVVAQMVRAAGGVPFVGDSPAFGSARGAAGASGLRAVADRLDLPIVGFRGKRYPARSAAFDRLYLAREAMEADLIINLPKLKSHRQLTLSLGVKNLFGCVPGKLKAWWHLEAGKYVDRFADMLVETARVLAPGLTIMDGIVGQEGNGPRHGRARFTGLIGAAADVYALDLAMAHVLDVDPQTVPTITAARRSDLGPRGVEEIEFTHLMPDDLRVVGWQLPSSQMPIDFGLPRLVRSSLVHLYLRFIKEPLEARRHS